MTAQEPFLDDLEHMRRQAEADAMDAFEDALEAAAMKGAYSMQVLEHDSTRPYVELQTRSMFAERVADMCVRVHNRSITAVEGWEAVMQAWEECCAAWAKKRAKEGWK